MQSPRRLWIALLYSSRLSFSMWSFTSWQTSKGQHPNSSSVSCMALDHDHVCVFQEYRCSRRLARHSHENHRRGNPGPNSLHRLSHSSEKDASMVLLAAVDKPRAVWF